MQLSHDIFPKKKQLIKSGMSALTHASLNARNTSAHANNTISLILVAETALQRSLSQQVISHSATEMPFAALHTGLFSLSQ